MENNQQRALEVYITACNEAMHECDNTIVDGGIFQYVFHFSKVRNAMNRRDEKIREAARLYQQRTTTL